MTEQAIQPRLGWVEAALLTGLLVAASWMVSAVALGWFLWAIPGLVYGPLGGLLYAVYVGYWRPSATTSIEARSPGPLRATAGGRDRGIEGAAAFRVLEVGGSCPFQRSVGDVVLVSRNGHPSLPLCPGAATALQEAARQQDGGHVEWRHPAGGHFVVFGIERGVRHGSDSKANG